MKINDDKNETNRFSNRINNKKTIRTKSFEYKTKLIGNTPDDNDIIDAEVVVPLKYLSNFWRSRDLLLINCEIKLNLKWTKNCEIKEASRTFREVDPNAEEVDYELVTATIHTIFHINNAKLYVPVVTLAVNDNIKFLENIKQGFKGTISWNKYRSEITKQPKQII